MSKAEESRAGTASAEGPDPALTPGYRCEAHELKFILQQIASHISEADRRHSEALGAMQDRLAELGRDAAEARSRLPGEMSPALDRIEDDMAVLAERMAGADADPHDIGWPVESADDGLSVSAGKEARQDDEPWDHDSAEALAHLYESDAAARSGGEQPGAISDGEEATRRGAERERILLEARCAEIAQRVEQALAEIRRECAFAELGGRFERLEQNVGRALAGAADRAERDNLDRIEAHIAELAGRFDAVQGQAARLDRIEAELRALAERMSDERMAELLGKAAAALPTETVAQLVADRVCAQMPQMDEARAEERRRLEDLHEVVNGFFSERREGDAQTATVLDTMQQAMIRLLDRMDAVEEATPAPMPAGTFKEDAPRASQPVPRREQSAATELDQWTADRDAPRIGESREPRYDPAIYQMYPEPGSGAQRGPSDPAQSARPRPVDAPPTTWHGDRLGYVPPLQDAQNVVAAARRAMRYSAQAESGEEAKLENAERAATRSGKTVEKRSSGLIRGFWFPSRLFIATIVVILVGATFAIATVVRKHVVGAPGEHMLLAPEGAPAELPKQDAGRGDQGLEPDPAGERQQQRGSGSHQPPALKQRTGEPPQRIYALEVDRLGWGKGQLSAFQARSAVDAGQAGGPDGEGEAPHPASVLARGSVGPHGIAMQETGSIAGAPKSPPARQQPPSNSTNPPAGGSPTDRALAVALIPEGPATGSPPAGGAGATTARTRTLNVLPPAAVGPHSLRLAAANGDPSAAFEVGARLAEGRGIPQDFEQAAAWYERAAARGFAPAQYRLATLLERGLGVSSDLVLARNWYARAAEQGHAKAMHNVAVLSIGGDRGPPDYAVAIEWFTKAAEHGLADSQYNLGVLYESGLGVARDLTLAYQWFALAAQAGDEEALRRRDLLRARIAAADQQLVDDAVRSWRAKPADPLINEPRTAGTLWQQRDPTPGQAP